MKHVKLFEQFVNEQFEVHYSDGIRAAKKFSNKAKAEQFMQDLIKRKGMREVAIYKADSGFHGTHQTDRVIAFWGDGSYLDNVSKKDADLAAKKIDESVNEGVYVPSNIEEFAKRRGALPLVKKIAKWAEKAGENINGGTAIGKGYDTLILDLRHHGGEIRINLRNDEVTLFDEPIKDAKSFKKVYDEHQGVNEGVEEKLAKEVAKLIGTKLDPESFYEYLQDYSKDKPNGEYGFDEDQLDTLIDAFDYIFQDGLGMTNLNTSTVKSSKLYKAYIKESVNEGSYEDFITDYGREIKSLSKKIQSIGKKFDSGKISEEGMEKAFKTIENRYDREAVSVIDGLMNDNGRTDLREIAQIAVQMQNRTGTEMQQIVNAMEDFVYSRELK